MKVGRRIEETVGVIDSQPGDFAVGDELQDLLVRGVENTRVFHPDGAQVVDVEKAPIVDLVEGGFPVGDAVRLTIEQIVQAIEAAGLSGLSVETRDRARRWRCGYRAIAR